MTSGKCKTITFCIYIIISFLSTVGRHSDSAILILIPRVRIDIENTFHQVFVAIMAVVLAALRAVHGGATIEQDISSYYLANDIAKMAESLATILDPQDWAVFQDLPMPLLAAWLLDTARHVQLRKYRKHPRGPKKPKPKRPHAPQQPYVSTARRLAKRKVKSAP